MEGLNYDERISGKCIDVAQEQRSERDNSLSLSINGETRLNLYFGKYPRDIT